MKVPSWVDRPTLLAVGVFDLRNSAAIPAASVVSVLVAAVAALWPRLDVRGP